MTWSTCNVLYINIIATGPNGYTVITYKEKIHKTYAYNIVNYDAKYKRSLVTNHWK